MENKTFQSMSDTELVSAYTKWQKMKRSGKIIEGEIKSRYDEHNGLTGINKQVIRKIFVWKEGIDVPIKEVKMTVSDVVKLNGQSAVEGKTTEKHIYTYKVV